MSCRCDTTSRRVVTTRRHVVGTHGVPTSPACVLSIDFVLNEGPITPTSKSVVGVYEVGRRDDAPRSTYYETE